MRTGVITTTTNSSCVSSASGSVSAYSNVSLGDSTVATLVVTVGGQQIFLTNNNYGNNGSGSAGGNVMFIVFGVGLLIVTVFLAYRAQASLAIVMSAGMLLILFFVGAAPLVGYGLIIGMVLVLALVLWRLKE
jgi:hypothetical protein